MLKLKLKVHAVLTKEKEMENILGFLFAVIIFGGGWYLLDRRNRKRGGTGLRFPGGGGSNRKQSMK